MNIRAYLVDDEPLALERLRRLLEETGRVEVAGSTTIPEDAIAALTTTCIDICFLDIEMPRLNGFDVLAALPTQPAVVFTTAYNQYALQAFEVNSIDYLLKPIDREHLKRALDKLQLRTAPQPDLRELLRQITAAIRPAAPAYPERIASRLGDRICFIDLPRVTYFMAEDKLTYAVSDGKRHVVDHSIVELETKLDPRSFFRIHRGTLLNLAWVAEVSSLPGGSLHVRLKDERRTDLTVARDRAREFRQKLGL